MDLTTLQYFVAVADEKSFSAAARHLFITQQNLSKHIARLEEELETPLFVRRRPLELTADGRRFYETAKEILRLKQQFDASSTRTKGTTRQVHIGVEHTVARAALPHVLPGFMAEHPEVFVKVNEEHATVLQKAVLHDAVDMAIGTLSSVPETYERVSLCRRDKLLIVPKALMRRLCGESYERVRKEFADGADLSFFASAPFLRMAPTTASGRALERYLKYYGISPRFVCELTNLENAFQLANSGLGVLVYSKLFWDMSAPELREKYRENVDVFPLAYLPGTDDVCAYYNREAGVRPEVRSLLDSFIGFFGGYSSPPEEKRK